LLLHYLICIKWNAKILKASDEINDEGTNAMMSDFIDKKKTIWMMQAWLEE
jgi:starvation-inducible DNA-binding protein